MQIDMIVYCTLASIVSLFCISYTMKYLSNNVIGVVMSMLSAILGFAVVSMFVMCVYSGGM